VAISRCSFPQGKLTFTRRNNGARSKRQDLLKGFHTPTIELGDLSIPHRHCLSPAGALYLQRLVGGQFVAPVRGTPVEQVLTHQESF
jgi:hypothetical protein